MSLPVRPLANAVPSGSGLVRASLQAGLFPSCEFLKGLSSHLCCILTVSVSAVNIQAIFKQWQGTLLQRYVRSLIKDRANTDSAFLSGRYGRNPYRLKDVCHVTAPLILTMAYSARARIPKRKVFWMPPNVGCGITLMGYQAAFARRKETIQQSKRSFVIRFISWPAPSHSGDIGTTQTK